MIIPFEEYTWWQNLIILTALVIIPLFALYVFKPLLIRFLEWKSGPIEEGTDVPDEEYWED